MTKEVLKDHFLQALELKVQTREPRNLYEPIQYILSLGGKRLRPLLVMMGADLYDAEKELTIDAALAVEMFHNFTLIHDDIMDEADLRRGKITVHKRWDLNAGILSGDALMILSYRALERYEGETFKALMCLFNKTALEVCEGQQLDIDFERMIDVPLDSYFTMIGYKTAVLVGCALQMGAIIGQADLEDQENLYRFGLYLGVAFQLQDDYLDSFGTEEFGKQIGGDIRENKKTYLYIKTRELASEEDRMVLDRWFASEGDVEGKIEGVKELYTKYGVPSLLREQIKDHTDSAFDFLEAVKVSSDKKKELQGFATQLMDRQT